MAANRSLRLFSFTALSALAACSSAPERDGATASSESALTPSSARADRELVRTIEDHRLLGDPRLRSLLHGTSASVVEAAAIAVGRIGDPSLEGDVIALLDAKAPEVRAAASLALGLLGGADAEAALAGRLGKEHDLDTRAALLLALGRVGKSASTMALVTAAIVTSGPHAIHAAAAEALATMVRGGVAPPADPAIATQLLAFAAESPESRAIPSAFAVAALSGARVAVPEAAVTSAFHAAPSASARAYLARSLAALKTATATQTLATASADDSSPRVRADACRLLGTTGGSAVVLDALSAALHERSSQVIVSAATAIATLGANASSLAPALGSTYDASRSAWVRSAVVTALVAVDPASSRARVEAGLTDAWPVKLAAIGALAALASDADIAALTRLAGDADTRFASAAIEAIATLDPARATPAVKDALRAALATKDWEVVASVADASVAFGWTDFAPALNALYGSFPGQAAMNGRLEIIYALGTIGGAADVPLLDRALDDDEVIVSQTAADSYRALTGTDVSGRVRKESVVHGATPTRRAIDDALRSVVVLETTRGTIALRMLPEAPLSATNFVQLASSGFYDGRPFHRVVPNFVAQGGDPRGDGTGGSDRFVREEISRVPHLRGTVGMATEGKDTGSSQFFFNEGWNVNLDNRYTVFAEVAYGLDVAERIEVGDEIVSATVLRGW